MKLQQLREKVRNRAGIATGDNFVTPQVIDDAINQAIFQIDAEGRWPWLEATQLVPLVAGQSSYSLPADFDSTRSVLLNTVGQASVALYEVASSVALAQNTASTGQPVAFAISQGSIILLPTPDSSAYSLTHLYYRTSTELVDDADEPLIHDQYHPAVVAAAAALVATREEQRSIKEAADLDVAQWVRRMRGALRQSTGPVVPRVRPGGWL